MVTELIKVTVNWTGFSGAPGFTNLYFRDFSEGPVTQAMVDGSLNRADLFFSSVQTRVPNTVSLQVQNTVQIIEATNGELLRFMTGPAKTVRVGSGTGSYSAASGAVVNWQTDGVRNGRRIRGRTFLVPVAGSVLSANGTLDDTHRTSLTTAGLTLYQASADQGVLGVWARPTAPGATDGEWSAVTSHNVPDKVAVLRSRRD